MKDHLLVLLIFCLSQILLTKSVFPRIQEDLDSIETSLAALPEDSGKVMLYGQLFYQFEFIDSVKARNFLNLAMQLAQTLNYRNGIATSYMQYGFLNDDIGNYNKAIEYYEKSLKIRIELQDQRGIAIMYNNIGIIYKEQARYPEALECYHKALKIAEESGNKGVMGLAYNNIGIVNDDQSNHSEAIRFYQKALEIAIELDDKMSIAGATNNIGIIYEKQGHHAAALDHYQKALRIYEEVGVKNPGVAGGYNNIGLMYFQHLELEATPEESYLRSLFYYRKSLEISEQIGDQEGITSSSINMGNTYIMLADYKLALKYLTSALVLSKKIGAPYRQKEMYEAMATLYEKQGNYTKALENYKYYTQTKDSLFNEEKSKDLGKLEAKHEFETAETERKREEEARMIEAKETESRRNNLQYSGILIFIVLFFTLVFFLGKLSIPIRLAEGMIFFVFLLLFEFTLVLLDPFIETYSHGAPAIKLLFNAVLAALIFPLHSFFEDRLKGRVIH